MSIDSQRPNPDALLARVQAEEHEARRGKLKIFFGYAAGVGKTYAMLEAARRECSAGVDVVVGYVEPHGRPETEALLQGLEVLPPRLVPYRGVTLREFDLDAALARRPRLLLVDELAHTNAEGSRHVKRWQDVEELLEAGIDVFSTLNVQHVESLNDVIAQITGVVVAETLPDRVLERASEIELIDLTPEDLIDRLHAGKVYVPRQAERALRHFFQKSNLLALRELSLRQTAHRLRRDVEAARREKAATTPWATNERLLVCVGPSPTTVRLIRTAKRMAAAFGADWLAVAVAGKGNRAAAARQQVSQHLRLAEQLGAETHTLVGDKVADTILEYARTRNVTKIVVGKTAQLRWKRFLFGTVVDQLLDKSGDIDVYVIEGEGEAPAAVQSPPRRPPVVWAHYLATAAVVVLCGLAGWLSHALELTEANIVMVFLLGVAYVAVRYGRGPAIAASVASVLVFDFFFVPPFLHVTVHDAHYVLTFTVMLTIGIIISTLTARLQEQLQNAQQLEHRTAALLRLTKQLTEIGGLEFLVRSAGQQLRDIFDGEVVLFVRDAAGPLQLRFGQDTAVARHDVSAVVAQWVADHDQLAGAGTDTLPNATALFAPMIGSLRTVGAVGVKPRDAERFLDPEQRRLLETCASLIALSIERDQSVLEAHAAQLQVQAEQLRNSLLSSVSHDLRTPLAAIAGASTSLLEVPAQDAKARQELLQTIVDESHRLTRLVDNLLDMTRLESGTVALNRQWHVLEEIVGSALARLRRELVRHPVRADIPSDLPLLLLDGVLFEQVFFNLLENAMRHTPEGSQIEITAGVEGKHVEIRLADTGPGLPPGSESRVFEKFFRGPISGSPSARAHMVADGRRGVGLGLAICDGIVRSHGGRISARNRPGGGAEFIITLPCEDAAPRVALDEVSTASEPGA
jgi:two-component system sensor histidine kinase KdpD